LTARRSIAVLGAGAWGTALANAAARAGAETILWARDAGHVAEIAADRENRRRLPGIALHDAVRPSDRIADVTEAGIVLAVVPAQALANVCGLLPGRIAPGVPVVVCAKGIERTTGRFMSEIVAAALPENPAAILSGPSFATDVASGLPTAVTLAAHNESLAIDIAGALAAPSLRLYHSTDVRGVEIGGAAKNVLAIACGIARGRKLGASAEAALVARGFAELLRFGRACGARPETLMGLSGLGDLVLTCGSEQSRNFSFGIDLGRGATVAQAGGGKLAEGAFTARILVDMATSRAVDMPIARSVADVLGGKLTVSEAIEALLTRPFRSEI